MADTFCVCRTGRVRSVNQDCAGCFSMDGWSLGYVADGMGGHYGGERASGIVAKACSRWWEDFVGAPQRPRFLQGVEQLRSLLRQCHKEIAGVTPPGSICGTTVVLLWVAGEEYALFSAGDSRCYEYAPDGIRTRTNWYNGDGALESYTIPQYNDEGKWIGDHTYDGQGNLIGSTANED